MRKKLKQKILFGLTAVLMSQFIAAQVAYHNFNSAAGLPSNETYCVIQDKAGYMWFATDHGVVRYDGYNFKTFTSTDGLTDNTVLSIKEDALGRLWFLTLSGGICSYDGKSFTPHPNNDTIAKLCNRRVPTSWEIIDDNTIWLGIVGVGFYKITSSETTAFFNEPVHHRSAEHNGSFFFLLKLKDERYIFTTSYGQNVMPYIKEKDVHGIETFFVDSLTWPYTEINFSLDRHSNGDIYIGTKYGTVCIHEDKIAGRFMWVSGKSVTRVKEVSDGRMWLLNQNGFSYTLYCKNDRINFSDSLVFTKSVSDIYREKNGNYWLTTLENGIYMIPNRNIRNLTDVNVSFASKISTFAADSTSLFAGLPNSKLLRVNISMTTSVIPTIERGASLISHLEIDKSGQPLTERDKIFEKVSGSLFYISKFIQISKNNFLVGGTGGFGLVENGSTIFDSRKFNFNKRVTELCQLLPGKFAIGTLQGLYYFTKGLNNITDEKELIGVRITSCKKLNNRIYGVATRGKGVFMKFGEKSFFLTEKKGLISDLTENIYFENDSILWVATFKGLSKVYYHFDGDSLYTRIRCYTKEDGLSSDQINAITSFNGYVWLATNEGLSYFHPEDLTEDTVNIPLFIRNIFANGIKQNYDSLVFEYFQNNVLIEFNALYYKALSGIRYKVRLKGIDTWKYITQNYIQYFNLTPGTYNLEVRAEDKFGKYKSEIRSVRFTIQPRFIDTLFFKLLIITGALTTLGIILYMIFNFQRLKAVNVIKLLQAEFKALNYQINPHFIFNVLNSIQYYILRKDTGNAVHMLSSFSSLIRKIVNNSKQQYISILEEVECLKEYMDLEKIRLDNKFEYEINIDSTIDLEKKEILPMIIQPLVENSIWHGIVPANRPGRITIDFKKDEGQILCIVEDNGVGINNTRQKEEKVQNSLSLAMKNVSERLKITSELNNSSWEVKTADKSNFAKAGTGTVVTVKFPALKE